MLRIRILSVMVVLILASTWTLAQGGATGALSGTVQDASGAVISGAQVTITSDATGQVVRKLTSDSAGAFTATLLPVGSYSMAVSASGFATTKYPGIRVYITETTRMIAKLSVTTVQQTVEVKSEVAQVNTTDATTGQSLGSTTITTLPLATRNFQQLLTLSSGASSDLNNASQLGRGQVFIHVNGGREDNNNYLIDGISVADYAFGELTYTPLPNPDAIQEFKVSTSLYDATQGRNGGGNINATLKTGTSKFHGSGWEYFRNTVLDANDFFLNRAGLPRPVIKQNIFGGDFGGPVGLKAQLGYFYVNYQGTRQRSGDSPGTFINTSIPVLPTDRSEANLLKVFFPSGGLTRIDPVALALLNAKSNQFGGGGGGWLLPTVAGVPGLTNGQLNYGPLILSDPGRFTDDQFTVNWDRDFRGGKDRLAERFFWSNSDTFQPFGADSFQIQTGGSPTPNNLNFPLEIPLHNRVGSLTETHLFTNAMVNEFRFGVNVIGDKLNNVPPVTGAQVGINLPTANGDPNMYRLTFGSWAFGPFPQQLQSALSDSFALTDTLSWTRGAHQLRFGGEIDRTTIRRNLPIADNGLVFFAGPTGFPTDFQSFLAGAPFFGEAGGGAGNHDYRIPAYAWFAQDDFRASKTLTLNLGLRNEFVGAPWDTLCHTGNTDPSLANVTGQPFVYPTCVDKYHLPGLVGTKARSGLNNNFATVFEPRIGFAYDVLGHHTTSIRGGYGMYSVREDLGAVDNLAISAPFFPFGVNFLPGPGSLANLFQPNPAINFPGIPPLGVISGTYVPQAALFQGFQPSCTLGNGNPSTDPQQCAPGFSGNVNSLIALQVPLHWIVATTQQWNLTVERELGKNWFMELGYVGTKGTHLRSTYDPNQARLATPQSPIVIPGYNCDGSKGAGAQCVIVNTTAENASARVPFLGIAPANFESFAPNSDSHYNSMQLSVAHRFSGGLYWQSAYTFAKSIDDVSTASVAFDTRFNDQTNARASRGLSDFDRRHRFVTSAVYELPFFSHDNGWKRGALGGWEASGVLIWQSGLPFTPIDSLGGSAYSLSSPNLATPMFAAGFSCSNAPTSGSVEARLGHWVNPAAYVPDPVVPLANGAPGDATAYGNAPRNCVIGPPQSNVDFTLGKTFKVAESQNLRFRADFFNLFNHPSFANPSATDIQSPSSFSQITSVVGTPRLIQFSLKYSF
ncbi:MAG TPA: carboxypeptidase-like regulatory domain-containing protein [Terriglobales bacterium]|nr:carboxypeptidase-like regulatory domain-containing protein [Terriglobales bacterium]